MGMGHLWLNGWGIYDLMSVAFITYEWAYEGMVRIVIVLAIAYCKARPSPSEPTDGNLPFIVNRLIS